MNITRLSRFLSLVLRHRPEEIGLKLDSEGWAEVGELLDCLQKSGTVIARADLEQVVAENTKQRFRFSEDGQRIRANQGHSIGVDLGLDPQTPPDCLFHGTATRKLESIRKDGLVKGSRQQVHLSVDAETAIAVGSRHGKPAVLRIDAKAMHRAGHLFYLSDNGVWLTDHVAPGFITS